MSDAVIWDVDGTLVDTAEMHYRSWVELAQQLKKPFSRDDFNATFGRRNPEIIPLFFGHGYTDRQMAELGNRKEELYRAEVAHGVELLPGARKLVDSLHRAGFRQAIGSSAPRQNVDLIMRLTRTEPFFEAVVSMEDTERGKPDPQVFLVAAQKLGIPPGRCVVFEDAVAGVQAAKAGGMKCVAVRFVGHHSAEKLQAAGADLVVESLEQVDVDSVRQLLEN